MIQTLLFTSDPNAKFSTMLGGEEYEFTTRYNERSSVWSFDLVLVKTGEVLAAGVAIVLGCDLLAPYALGIGSMYALDMSASAAQEAAGMLAQSTDAGPDDLGTRVVVVYVPPGEVLG
jgi:hypothetical protein